MDAKETVELEHGEVRKHVPSRPGIGSRRPSVLIGRRLAECKLAIIVTTVADIPEFDKTKAMLIMGVTASCTCRAALVHEVQDYTWHLAFLSATVRLDFAACRASGVVQMCSFTDGSL